MKALFDAKGMVQSSSDKVQRAKKIAKATIKEGRITVTAVRDSGIVKVWLVEVKNKEVVTENPKSILVETRKAPSSLVLTTKTGNTIVKNLNLMLVDGGTSESTELKLMNRREKLNLNLGATFTLTEGNGKTEEGIVEAYLSEDRLIITPLAEGITTLTVKNLQSSKQAKLKVSISKAYKITIPAGVTVTYKQKGKIYTAVDGGSVPDGVQLKITASGKKIRVNNEEVTNGTYKVNKQSIKITVTED